MFDLQKYPPLDFSKFFGQKMVFRGYFVLFEQESSLELKF